LSAAALAPDLRARIASAWDDRPPHGLDTGIYAPLPKRGTKAGERISFEFAEQLTLHDPAHLARALAAMGLTRRIMTVPRAGTPLWYECRLRGADVRDSMLDWPVLLMASPEGAADAHLVWLCAVSGDWVTNSGGARGRGVTSLAQFVWGVSEFEAARRLCRANGWKGVLRVGDLR
jgi:hypothetical protein